MGNHVGRVLAVTVMAVSSAAARVAPATAEPAPPWLPSTQSVEVRDVDRFKIVDERGVWFVSPRGVQCAINEDGSFGCSGPLPGVPSDINEVGWFPDDTAPRLYHTDTPRFASGRRQAVLTRDTYLDYHGSRCGITPDSWVYCLRPGIEQSLILVATTATLLSGAATPP